MGATERGSESNRSAAPPGDVWSQAAGAHRPDRGDRGPVRTLDEQVQAGPEFVELRRRHRRFVFPMTAAFLLWYLAYVLLAGYAPEVMAVPVADGINLGFVIGLLQFVTTFAISTAYALYGRRRLDPLAEQLKERVERGRADGGATARFPRHPDGLFGDAACGPR